MTDVNANIAECVKSASHFGYTQYVNVCSGAITDVPWGGVDWLVLCGVSTMLVLFVVLIVGFIFMIATDL